MDHALHVQLHHDGLVELSEVGELERGFSGRTPADGGSLVMRARKRSRNCKSELILFTPGKRITERQPGAQVSAY
jgi:hypothetical protein